MKFGLERPYLHGLLIAFACTVCAFVGSTVYAELAATAIDVQTGDVVRNALPSIEQLAAARTALRHVEQSFRDFGDAHHDAALAQRTQERLAGERAELQRVIDANGALPTFAGERELTRRLDNDLRALDALLVPLNAKKPVDAPTRDAFQKLVDDTDRDLSELLLLNASGAQKAGAEISRIRHRSMRLALALDLLSALFAVAAIAVVVRAMSRYATLERAHQALLRSRAAELETFAQRVAHDLLSPLSALSFSLSVMRPPAADAEQHRTLARAKACVRRARTMVDGIFHFARSGATPTAGAQANLREALDGVVDDLELREPGREVDLIIEPHDPLVLGCSPGVLTSILSNLLGNAVKYTRDSALRQVHVRVSAHDSVARVEISDTGPGLPVGLERTVFDPYVRAPGVTQPGLGLGLATVRRLCEAHGGAVGVESELGYGCTFWFELPLVGLAFVLEPAAAE